MATNSAKTRRANATIDLQQGQLKQQLRDLEITNQAMAREITARKKAEQRLNQSRPASILPAMEPMSREISRVFLELRGPAQAEKLKQAIRAWRSNRVHGPSSLNLLIEQLAGKLPPDRRNAFNARARDCIRV